MKAQQLLTRLYGMNVKLWVDSGQLKMSANTGLLNEEMISMIRSYKADLIEIMDKDPLLNHVSTSVFQVLIKRAEEKPEFAAIVLPGKQLSYCQIIAYINKAMEAIQKKYGRSNQLLFYACVNGDWQDLILALAAIFSGYQLCLLPSSEIESYHDDSAVFLKFTDYVLFDSDAAFDHSISYGAVNQFGSLGLPAWGSSIQFSETDILCWCRQMRFAPGEKVVLDGFGYECAIFLDVLSVWLSGASLYLDENRCDVRVTSNLSRINGKCGSIRYRGLDIDDAAVRMAMDEVGAKELWLQLLHPNRYTLLYTTLYLKEGEVLPIYHQKLQIVSYGGKPVGVGEPGLIRLIGDENNQIEQLDIQLQVQADNRLTMFINQQLYGMRYWNQAKAIADIVTCPWVADAYLTVRMDIFGNARIVAYVVSKSDISYSELEKSVKDHWYIDKQHRAWNLDVVAITHLPLQNNGRIDSAALSRVIVADSEYKSQWTKELAGRNNGANTVVVMQPIQERQTRFHIDRLLHKSYQPSQGKMRTVEETHSDDKKNIEGNKAFSASKSLPLFEKAPLTLTELLLMAANRTGGSANNDLSGKLIFIDREGREDAISYSDLLDQSCYLAGGIIKAGIQRGDCLILQFETNKELLTAYWACILSGVIALPQPVPSNLSKESADIKRLLNIQQRYNRPGILCSENLYQPVSEVLAELSKNSINCHSFADLIKSKLPFNIPDFDPDETALMFTTSGSTGIPKAVMHTHQTVVKHAKAHASYLNLNQNCASLNWMPLTHVGGFIMFHLREMLTGAGQIHVDMSYILDNPLRWLKLIDRYRVYSTWAPNFAFALINNSANQVKELPVDLSCLRSITNAGEQLVMKTTREFLKLLEPLKLNPGCMNPAWGMTETSSAIIYNCSFELSKTSNSDPFVELGNVIAGTAMRIVDEEGEPVCEGENGQLQVKGETITPGYYLNDEQTRKTFTHDGWLITGDTGFIKDGCLTLTGRESDIVIINGINYPCHEIEAVVEEVSLVATSYSAVCAIRMLDDDTDKLAVFFVAESNNDQILKQILQSIQQSLTRAFGFSAEYLLPVELKDIPKTSLGKIQRGILKKRFLNGEFSKVTQKIDGLIGNDKTLPNWFYKPCWMLRHIASPTHFQTGDDIVIIIGSKKVSDVISEMWASHNQLHVCIQPDRTVKQLNDKVFSADLSDKAQLSTVFSQILSGGKESYKNRSIRIQWFCLYNESFDAGVFNSSDKPVNWQAQQKSVLLSIIALVHAIHGIGKEYTYKLDVYSRAALRFGAEDEFYRDQCHLSVMGFEALIKTVSLENPNIHVKHIDTDHNIDLLGETVAKESILAVSDSLIIYRSGKRYVSRLEALAIENVIEPPLPDETSVHIGGDTFKNGGVYIVTGALGGIGFRLAKWMQECWSVNLIIPGRRAVEDLNNLQTQRLKDLNEGGELVYQQVALDDLTALQKLVSDCEDKWKKSISGVLHLAGVGNINDVIEADKAIPFQTTENIVSMYEGKVYGAYALHELTQNCPDALFLVFSSVNAEFGGISFGLYSAANAWLQHLIYKRRAAGLEKSYCVAWSSWRDLGMSEAALPQVISSAGASGYSIISEAQGFASLAAILRSGEPYVVVGIDSRRQSIARQVLSARLNCYQASLVEESDSISTEFINVKDRYNASLAMPVFSVKDFPKNNSNKVDDNLLLRMLSKNSNSFDGEALRGDTEHQLAGLWKNLLGDLDIKADTGFFEAGGNSIKAGQLTYKINAHFGIDLLISVLFEVSTLRELAKKIDHAVEQNTSSVYEYTLEIANRDEKLPLSFSQKRLWVLDKMLNSSAVYNVPLVMRVKGPLHLEALRSSFQTIIGRHESLRTAFVETEAGPVQHILNHCDLPFELVNGNESEVDTFISDRSSRTFDLSTAPLIRLHVLRCSKLEHVVMINMHHIISDGWSVGILQGEFLALYRAYIKGESLSLPELQYQFADYSQWLHKRFESELSKTLEKFWLERLKSAPPLLPLPIDFPRPAQQSYAGATTTFTIPLSLCKRLNAYAKDKSCSLFMVLLTAYKVLLSRVCRTEDILVGTPVANRPGPEFEKIFGFFVNNIVLRTNVPNGLSIDSVLSNVKEEVVSALEHQLMPFDRLLELLDTPRNASYSPVFQTMFALQNAHDANISFDDMEISAMPSDTGASKYDLTVWLAENEKGIIGTIEYCTDLFSANSISRLCEVYVNILNLVENWPELKAEELNLLCNTSGADIVSAAHTANLDAFGAGNIYRQFEEHAKLTPHAVALTGDKTVTYIELHQLAGQYANLLRANGVTPGEIVAIYMPRNAEFIAVVLAVLRVGAAYLPLDDEYPEERLAFMFRDAEAILLIGESVPHALAEVAAVYINTSESSVSQYDTQAATQSLPDTAPSYVIYTSGSTGKPKGVLVSHAGLLALSYHLQREFKVDRNSRMLMFGSVSFDASVGELMGSLFSGACLHTAKRSDVMSVESLTHIINKDRISHIILPPSLLALMSPDDFNERCCFMAVGEACPVALARQWSRRHDFYNGYGPTEATVLTTVKTFLPHETSMTVGKSVDNLHIYIVNEFMQLQPLAAPGELCIGGPGLANGYINRPGLTSERFIPNPFSSDPGQRLYRTGDLARYREDGEIEYLGRLDHQVKISGHRIELGEIENTLNDHFAVNKAAVITHKRENQPLRLLAYIKPEKGHEAESLSELLRRDLSKSLPHFMLPHHFILLESLPLTDSGKVDRNSLPEPAMLNDESSSVRAPKSMQEHVLLEVWQDVLAVKNISMDDNFFSLGGDSILAIQIISRLRARGYRVDARKIFEGQTIAGIAPYLMPVDKNDEVEVFSTGSLPLTPIANWFFSLEIKNISHWNQCMVLSLKKPEWDALFHSLYHVTMAHDVLHSCYQQVERDGEIIWRHTIEPLSLPEPCLIDLESYSSEDAHAEINFILNEIQKTLDITQGRVHMPVVIRISDSILIAWVLHHLVSDLITMHTLKQDLETCYREYQKKHEIKPLPRSASYRQWSLYLQSLVKDNQWVTKNLASLLDKQFYTTDRNNLRFDTNKYTGTKRKIDNLSFVLSAEKVSDLRSSLQSLHNVDLDVALISAFSSAVQLLSDKKCDVNIMLESHGRDYLSGKGPDISRTAGWFTRLFPVKIKSLDHFSPISSLLSAKESLALASSGADAYSILRYLCDDRSIQSSLKALPGFQISMNYLGEMQRGDGGSESTDIHTDDIDAFNIAPFAPELIQDCESKPPFVMDILTMLINGDLHFNIRYSTSALSKVEVEAVLTAVENDLLELLNALSTQNAAIYTPSDFPDADFENEDFMSVLDAIADENEIA